MKLLKYFDRLFLHPINWAVLQWNSYIYNPLYFKSMKKKADNLHKIHGYQFHVMPLSKGKLIIMSKSFSKPGSCVSIKFYNNLVKKKGGRLLDVMAVLKMAYYSTPQKR